MRTVFPEGILNDKRNGIVTTVDHDEVLRDGDEIGTASVSNDLSSSSDLMAFCAFATSTFAARSFLFASSITC